MQENTTKCNEPIRFLKANTERNGQYTTAQL